MNFITKVVAAASFALAAGTAQAAVIDFEDLSNGDIVTTQYSGVTFSSSGSSVNKVTTQPGIGFGNNFLCTAGGAGASINCTDDTILTFASGVSNLSFWQVGDNTTGVVAMVDVFVGGVLSATVDILGFDDFSTPNLVDLTAFSNVTSIRIHSITDRGGLGWDDFSYDAANVVPLPAGMVLLLSALGPVCVLRRRR